MPTEAELLAHLQDSIATAIGAEPAETWQNVPAHEHPCLAFSHCKLIQAHKPIVYGGDLTNRVKSVADAIASGKQAAIALDTYFNSGWDAVSAAIKGCQVGPGPAVSMEMYLGEKRKYRNPHLVSYSEINLHYFKSTPRAVVPVLPSDDRKQSFKPVESMLAPQTALEESQRCFNCGICNACDYCRLYCPEMSVIVENSGRGIDLDYCKGCGLCANECPTDAIQMIPEEK